MVWNSVNWEEWHGRFLLKSPQNLSVCGLDYDPKASKAHANTHCSFSFLWIELQVSWKDCAGGYFQSQGEQFNTVLKQNGSTRSGAKCRTICQCFILLHEPNKQKIREKRQYKESDVKYEGSRGLLWCSDADLKLSLSGRSSYKFFSNKKENHVVQWIGLPWTDREHRKGERMLFLLSQLAKPPDWLAGRTVVRV